MIAYRSNLDDGVQYVATINGQKYGSCAGVFSGNRTLNSSVTIGNKVTNCANMFWSCTNFNQPITIPSSVTDCSGMFMASGFNQPITIPSSVTDCSNMFAYIFDFNKSVTISNGVRGCANMFRNCYRSGTIPSSLTIPETVTDISNMFTYAGTMNDIYIKGKAYRWIGTTAFVQRYSTTTRLNIHFNSSLNNRFNITAAYSIVGAAVTWTAMTNGFYNATKNIYCYYNYAG